MPKAKPLPPAELLHSRYDYDPDTGVLTSRRTGKPISSRYRRGVWVDKQLFVAARVIWKMMTGEDPPAEVDHENLDPTDDRWKNLRDATRTQNNRNRRSNKRSTTGLKGVKRIRRGRDTPAINWQAGIRVDGKYIYLGSFDTAEAAHEAYKTAAVKFHGAFARW